MKPKCEFFIIVFLLTIVSAYAQCEDTTCQDGQPQLINDECICIVQEPAGQTGSGTTCVGETPYIGCNGVCSAEPCDTDTGGGGTTEDTDGTDEPECEGDDCIEMDPPVEIDCSDPDKPCDRDEESGNEEEDDIEITEEDDVEFRRNFCNENPQDPSCAPGTMNFCIINPEHESCNTPQSDGDVIMDTDDKCDTRDPTDVCFSDCSKTNPPTCTADQVKEYTECVEKNNVVKCQFLVSPSAPPRFFDVAEAFQRSRYYGLDYSKGLEAFIKEQEISPWWASWWRGNTMDALLTYTCSARSSSSSAEGVILTSSTNRYASIEGEYFHVPELGEKPYLYKFTFNVAPECETEFSVFVKTNAGTKIPIFKRNGAAAIFKANETGSKSWIPHHSDEKLPDWKLIPGRNQHPFICMSFNKGYCFLVKHDGPLEFCNDIVGSPYAYSGSGVKGEDNSAPDNEGDDSDADEEGEVTLEEDL